MCDTPSCGMTIGAPASRCQGRWYLCDDSWVGEATEEAVRGCQAFQLFYSRTDVGDAC